MVHMVIEGFRTSGDPDLMSVAEQLAMQWLKVNYHAYTHTRTMFEKYNVSACHEDEIAGSGGEYEVQVSQCLYQTSQASRINKYQGMQTPMDRQAHILALTFSG